MFQGMVMRGAGLSDLDAGNVPLTASNSRHVVWPLRNFFSVSVVSFCIAPRWVPFALPRPIRYVISQTSNWRRSTLKVSCLSRTDVHLNLQGEYQLEGKYSSCTM